MLLSVTRWRTRLVAVGLLALFIALPGCGKKRAVVKGKITWDNQPLKMGTIAFIAADNRSGSAQIANGTYTVNDAPTGDVKIVITMPPKPMAMLMGKGVSMPKPPPGMAPMKPPPGMEPKGDSGSPMIDPKDIPNIPAKYTSLESTPLTFKVQSGENTHDIALTP